MKFLVFARDLNTVWLGLVLFLIVSVAFLQPVPPNDYWWYVRLGEEIVTTGAIPTVDTFTYTQAGKPFVYHSWLSATLFWMIYDAGGMTFTVLLKGILLALFYLLIWDACRLAGAGKRTAILLAFLAALAGSNNWTIRPQLFSYPLFALTLVSLLHWLQGRLLWLCFLPIIVLLWVNLHGAFILSFLLVGAALVGDFASGRAGERASGRDEGTTSASRQAPTAHNMSEHPQGMIEASREFSALAVSPPPLTLLPTRRRAALILALGVMFLASLLNPRGIGAWAYVLTLLTDPSSQQLSVEWKSPSADVWQGALFFLWLLCFTPLASASKNRLQSTHWLWFLGFGWMAVSGIRYVIWFLALLAPLTGYLVAGLRAGDDDFASRFSMLPSGKSKTSVSQGIAALNLLIVLSLFIFCLALLPNIRPLWWDSAPPIFTSNTPVKAVDWLGDHPELSGPLWSDIAFSSYIIYALPSHPVWNDTRFELFPVEQWERYIEISEGAPNSLQLLNEEGVKLVMIHPKNQERLFAILDQSKPWHQEYLDENAAIFYYR